MQPEYLPSFILRNQQSRGYDGGCEEKNLFTISFIKMALGLSYKHPGDGHGSASEDLPKLFSFIHWFAFSLIDLIVLYSAFSHMV